MSIDIDTSLPQWLYERFARRNCGYLKPWKWLDLSDQEYWAMEAAEVRRAVSREA